MKIAHISDLHVHALEGNSPRRFIGKRISGLANLKLKRKHVHHTSLLESVLAAVREEHCDHVIISGDLTNLALESEFTLGRQMVTEGLRHARATLTIVPGNHDAYTGGAFRSGRLAKTWADCMQSDLPELAAVLPMGRFPLVQLRGPLAIVALSSAVPRPPLMAAGELGTPQLLALRNILQHAEVAGRAVLVVLHHPPYAPARASKAWLEGLHDARELANELQAHPRVVTIHGHLHRRITTTERFGPVFGATSASFEHASRDRHAGYNLYEWSEGGMFEGASARVAPASGWTTAAVGSGVVREYETRSIPEERWT
jgi:3',5'-cyclic AMP phosphodiesterase CpdA